MNSKKIAILQSNYIPWKGYFDIINEVDEFILYDDVQYTKNDWRNRNLIKTRHGLKWLTIPIKQNKLEQKIFETKPVNQLWRKKHWTSLVQNYSKTIYFKDYSHLFKNLYISQIDENETLSQINYKFIVTINKILNINTDIRWSHEFDLPKGRTERLISICQQCNATDYITGPAAKDYFDVKMAYNNNIKLTWYNYDSYPEYQQLFSKFAHNVTILDLIFNEGPNAHNYMKSFVNE